MHCFLNPMPTNCPSWNEHLFRVNEMLEHLRCPIEVDVNDRRNKNVSFAVIDGIKKAFFLSDKVWIESWEEDHRAMLHMVIADGSDSAIFKTDEAVIYVDRTNYFYLGTNVEYKVKGQLNLLPGMNVIPSIIPG